MRGEGKEGSGPCDIRPTSPVAWKLVVHGPLAGFENMEADEALLESQKNPDALPVLRFFRWKAKTFTFGRLQDHHKAANQTMVLGARSMARRPTGGGSVLHDKDLSFSLTWRRDHPGFPVCVKNLYRGIHETVREALGRKGVEATFAPQGKALSRESLCFEEPVQDDLMWRGKKILGGALRVTSWGRLYQGNFLWEETGIEFQETLSLLARGFEETFFKSPPTLSET